MHAVRILQKWMGDALPGIQRARLNAVLDGVEGLLRGQRLWLAALGRNVEGRTLEKHKIKRIDRLLGNHRLSSEQHGVYAWIAGLVLGPCRHPVIIVDWSDIDTAKKLFLLRAAVSVGGVRCRCTKRFMPGTTTAMTQPASCTRWRSCCRRAASPSS